MSIKVGKVAMVPLESIEVGKRARMEMGDIDELEFSLRESGLINPLAVRELENNKYELLAGERRLIALRKNNVSEIPVRVYPSDISELEIKTIEMSENFYRKNMEYWEYDNLIKEIHELKQTIHGAKSSGPGQGWSMEDTAEMVGTKSKASVSTAIRRAEAREVFPELFESCKTQHDATKVLKKMDEAVIKHALAQKLESGEEKGDLKKLADSFIINDFFKGVKKIPDRSIHLVEIDPPYAIDLANMKKESGESRYNKTDYNEIESSTYQQFLRRTFRECHRVMTDHSWLICWFAPQPWFEVVFQEMLNAGFESTRMCGLWVKSYGQSKRPEIHLANAYEMFFYAWKGRPALNKAGRTNLFTYPPVSANQKTHPTERPVELMYDIYNTFTFPGSRILIPFLGSGSGLIAAHQLGLPASGFELSQSYKDSFLVKLHSMKQTV